MSKSDPDSVSYSFIVRGLHEDVVGLFSERFPRFLSGVGVREPRLVYRRVYCDVSEIDDALAWIRETLSGKYATLELGISVHTPRNWSNLDVPTEVVGAAHKHDTPLRVMFSSPAI